MDLYEYQARDLFCRRRIPVLPDRIATSPEEARDTAQAFLTEGAELLVVKAQVKTDGRGKAGGIKLARTPEEVVGKAQVILGLDIKGHIVKTLLIASDVDIAEEHYFSILLDRSKRRHLALCSREEGMNIGTLMKKRPEAPAKVALGPLGGIDDTIARKTLHEAGFTPERTDRIAPVLVKFWKVFTQENATLVEVNPLALATDGSLWIVDGEVTFDDNVRFYHPDRGALVDVRTQDPCEMAMKAAGLNYVRLEGEVGIISNGTDLIMSALDVVAIVGRNLGVRPANFLDIGGGASVQVAAKRLEIILGDEQVHSVFVNVFGGIIAYDAVANGTLEALEAPGDQAAKPIIVRLDDNKVEEGRVIISTTNHSLIHMVEMMDEAAHIVAELVAAK